MRSTFHLSMSKTAILVLITLAAYLPIALAQAKIIYNFDYGFFPGSISGPPSLTDLNTLICLTNDYATTLYREVSGVEDLVVEFTNIAFEFYQEELQYDDGLPFYITMAADITGTNLPGVNAMVQYPFDNIVFIENYLHTSDSSYWKQVMQLSKTYGTGVPEPGQLEGGVCDGSFTEAATEVTRPSRPQATEAPTPAPTIDPNGVVVLTIEFEFTSGDSREPTPEELDELFCLTDQYFALWFQGVTRDPALQVTGTKTQHMLNQEGALWVMQAFKFRPEENKPDPEFIAEVLNEASRADRIDFIQNYCWETEQGNLFRSVTSVEFLGQVVSDFALTDLDPTCGSTSTPAPTDFDQTASPTSSDTSAETGDRLDRVDSAVVFQFNFAVDEGLRSPTVAETESLLCRTDAYLLELLTEKTGDEAIESYSSLLEVNYDEFASDYPISIIFASNTTNSTSGEPLNSRLVAEAVSVTADRIVDYIETYVLDTTSDDVFSNTIGVSYSMEQRDEVEELEMPWPRTCPVERDESTVDPSTGNPTETTTGSATSNPTAPETAGPTSTDYNISHTSIPSQTLEYSGVTFLLEYGLTLDFGVALREPTETEVEDLMCKTDDFFRTRIQNETSREIFNAHGTEVGWEIDPSNELYQIKVTFLIAPTFGSGTPVPKDVVVSAMEVGPEDILLYIEEYVLATDPGNVFSSTTSVNFTDYVDGGPELGTLIREPCATVTPSPTIMGATTPPTSSPTTPPTSSPTTPPTSNPTQPSYELATLDPSAPPLPTSRPSDDGAPTVNPTVAVTGTNNPIASATEGPNEGVVALTPAPVTAAPTGPTTTPTSSPTVWVRYTTAPVAAPTQGAPTGLHLSTGIFPVRVQFLISNLAGLTDENTIRFSSGLDVGWSTFTSEIVENVTKHWIASGKASGQRRQLAQQFHSPHHRGLSISRVPNSAKVTSIKQVQCGKTDHLDATCLMTNAEYMYDIRNEYFYLLNQTFYNETNKALRNGTFQYILERESPGTPLVIGRIEREAFVEYSTSSRDGSDGDGGGMSGGAKFAIVLLFFVLAGIPLYIFYRQRMADKAPGYEEEDFVYDFFIPSNAKIQTEVDDFESRRKSIMAGIAAPEDLSTASSDDGPAMESNSTAEEANEANDGEGDIEVQAPAWWGNESANLSTDDIFENEGESSSMDNTALPVSREEQGIASKSRSVSRINNVSGPYGDADSKFGMSMREPCGDLDSKFEMSMKGPYGDSDSKFGMSMREPYGDSDNKFGMSMREPYGDSKSNFDRSMRAPPADEVRESAPYFGWKTNPAGAGRVPGRGYQAGGQEPHERDPTWAGYDDHLRGLVSIGAAGRGEEESISFSNEHDDEDEGHLFSFDHGVRPYEDNGAPDIFVGRALDSSHSKQSLGLESMESEGGWDDESGHSSHSSSEKSAELWA